MKKNIKAVKVNTSDLKLGMFVVDVGRGWLTHPWPTKSKLLTSKKDIEQLVEHGIKVVLVDPTRSQVETSLEREYGITEKTAREARKIAPTQMAESGSVKNIRQVERRKKVRPEKPTDSASQEEELPRAKQAYERALNVTREFINDVRAGKSIEVSKAQESVENMIDSVFRSRGALAALLKLKNYDEYTFTHSLNVTTLAVTVGRHLEMSREDLSTMGIGAMFHDVGKFLVPSEILNKPGKLTDEEFAVMKTHAALGANFLETKNKNLSPEAIAIARHHHERIDGSGYPEGLKSEEINDFIAICGMSDVYDALSSDRVYHKGKVPHEALKIVFSLRGKHFPDAWVDRFVQCIGIYPVGTTVKLNTGEVGVVTQINFESLVKPVVHLMVDPKGRRMLIETDADLADKKYDGVDIVKVMNPVDLGIDVGACFIGI